MRGSEKERYSYSLFQEPWWLDIVAPGQWNEAVVEKGGHLIARLPYIERKKSLARLKIVDQPPFTNTLGPWIAEPKGKYSKQLSTYSTLLQDLVSQIPEFDYFEQNLHHKIDNWLPFHWDFYEMFLSYTLIVEDLSTPEAVWDEMQPRIRNNIRKAEDRVEIKENLDIDFMIDIIKETYKYRNSKEKFCVETLKRIEKEMLARDGLLSLFVVDQNHDIRAVSFIVYDDRSAHFLLNGVNRAFNDSQVNSLLIWEGIKRCCGKTREFNFHGNIHPQVFSYFLKFGARLKPFFRICKSSRRMRVCKFMERVGRRLRLVR
jgi:hypothetical protein